ncbi:uncharacterized protein LOC134833968 [Culicoides brevitarsis]|uniref:uncharacterized protein LOC134833968 n=1 Tax=Culicoides brevitarsis TaxID=469753 RepID=UPI00307B6DF7
MPEPTNYELKKLIHQVIVKIQTIETKLDLLLDENNAKREVEVKQAPVYVEQIEVVRSSPKKKPKFSFSPIKDDKELDLISKKIQKDKEFKNSLLNYMKYKPDLKLEDLFTADFLLQCNHTGAQKRRNVENLVPYQQIYIEHYKRLGKSLSQIKKLSLDQLYRVKNRVRMNRLRKRGKNTEEIEYEDDDEELYEQEMDHEDTIIEELEPNEEESEEIYYVESLDDENLVEKIEEDDENVEYEYVKEEEIVEEEESDFDEAFTPIKNDRDLNRVSRKIETDPVYLKDLRLRIVQESESGPCNLEQLFTPEYLSNANFWGTHDKISLSELLPYKEVYCYLKRHLGQSKEEIERDAKAELLRLKNRYRMVVKRQKDRLNKSDK